MPFVFILVFDVFVSVVLLQPSLWFCLPTSLCFVRIKQIQPFTVYEQYDTDVNHINHTSLATEHDHHTEMSLKNFVWSSTYL